MPSLGADMDRGTIVEWRVRPGDVVHRGDIVAVVDTDKSDIEVEVFEDGVVTELLVPEGEEVPVGTPLARLAPAGTPPSPPPPPAAARAREAPPEPGPAAERVPAASEAGLSGWPAHAAPAPRTRSPLVRHLAEQADLDVDTVSPGADGVVHRADVERALHDRDRSAPSAPPSTSAEGARRASPYARRLAEEAGLDLSQVSASGPGGAVVAGDVERATAGVPRGERPDKRTRTRLAIAAVMARSKREIPHFYLASSIDLAAVVDWLDRTNATRSVQQRLLPVAVLLKATAVAAARTPGINGYWSESGFRAAPRVDLGVAVALRGGGVVNPAIRDADARSLDELMAQLRDLVGRARAGAVRSSETDASITVTNLGDQGVDEVYGVIHPPQVALVGFGRIVDEPVVEAGAVVVHPTVRCTLSADHRAVDGHLGSRFLRSIDDLLQDPALLAAHQRDEGVPDDRR